MPRKQKTEKRTVAVVVEGRSVHVTLHPPAGARRTWFAYWAGAVYSRSTGEREYDRAVTAAERMVRGEEGRTGPDDAVLTDEEFEAIQVAHYTRRTDPAGLARAEKTLAETRDAIAAFKQISGLAYVARATPDDCARFQRDALTRPRNWRAKHPKSRETDATIRSNTMLKWSRMLRAAFGRANRNAGSECVRGVVAAAKLLTANPWREFTWIEGTSRPLRQFDAGELVSLLGFLENHWPDVRTAALALKVYLWSCCRKSEVAGLTWDMAREVSEEAHFEVVGKCGVLRWFRLPRGLYDDLRAQRTDSRYVFAAYSREIRAVHEGNAGCQRKIRDEFAPANFARWMHERLKDWSGATGASAHLHVMRKTALQLAYDAEEEAVGGRGAADAGLGERVMRKHYVKQQERQRSNRMYARLLSGLPAEVARRYGHAADAPGRLEQELEAARGAGDWAAVAALAGRLAETGGGNQKNVG